MLQWIKNIPLDCVLIYLQNIVLYLYGCFFYTEETCSWRVTETILERIYIWLCPHERYCCTCSVDSWDRDVFFVGLPCFSTLFLIVNHKMCPSNHFLIHCIPLILWRSESNWMLVYSDLVTSLWLIILEIC